MDSEEGRHKGGLDIRLRVFDALFHAMGEPSYTPLDGVKVKQLCAEAKISRPTFYSYFDDKYAVISWFIEVLGDGTIGRIGQDGDPERSILNLLKSVAEYRDFLLRCLRSRYYKDIYPGLIHLMVEAFSHGVLATRGDAISEQMRFDIERYSMVLEGTMADWVQGRLDYTPETLARYLVDFMPARLRGMLSARARDNSSAPKSFAEIAATYQHGR